MWCRCRCRRWRRYSKKGIPHGFRDALRAVEFAASIITARADVDVLCGWEAQTGQGPVAAGRSAVAQGSVVHVVGGRLKGNTRKLRAGAAAYPGNGALCHGQVLQRAGVVIKRAKQLRVCPPMLVKKPPAKTLPSACSAIE